jgi:hypothetical protein
MSKKITINASFYLLLFILFCPTSNGEILSWRNNALTQDVDDSGSIKNRDALIIINKLNNEGSHLLVAPTDPLPISKTGMYWDTNGDGWIKDTDVIEVFKYLNSSHNSGNSQNGNNQKSSSASGSQNPTAQVRFRLATTDIKGNPITSIKIHDFFLLKGYVQDLRSNPQGVFAAYFDIRYPSDNVKTDELITGSPDYPNSLSGSQAPGWIKAVGAAGGITSLGGEERMLFRLKAQALTGGEVTFTAGPGDRMDNDLLVYGSNDPVPAGDISAENSSLTVFCPGKVQFGNEKYSVLENAGTATLNVLRNGGSDGEIKVNYATRSGGTAQAGIHFVPAAGTLVFAPGETEKTFSVAILDNTLGEENKTINLSLTVVQGEADLGTPATATVTILDDETPDLIIESITPLSENPKPNFPVKLQVTVKNIGLRTAPSLDVSIWKHRSPAPGDESGKLSSQTVYNLTVGQSVALDFYVTYEEQGTFTFWAMADAKKEVKESNEENNTLSLGIDTAGHTFLTSGLENGNTPAQAAGGCGTGGLPLILLTAVGFVLVIKWSNP